MSHVLSSREINVIFIISNKILEVEKTQRILLRYEDWKYQENPSNNISPYAKFIKYLSQFITLKKKSGFFFKLGQYKK